MIISVQELRVEIVSICQIYGDGFFVVSASPSTESSLTEMMIPPPSHITVEKIVDSRN